MYEYHTEALSFSGLSGGSLIEQFRDYLNAHARAGWEYVGLTHLEGGEGLSGEQLEVNLGGSRGGAGRAQVAVFRRQVQ